MNAEGTTYRLEPTRLDPLPKHLVDLVAELAAAAATLDAAFAPETAESLASAVRVMNCYYSNLIEGHNTRLKDIQAALDDYFSEDASRRSLQLEARAHVRVQEHIDQLAAAGKLPEPASADFVRKIHSLFYDGATLDMLRVGEGSRSFLMAPGVFREPGSEKVIVGLHQPPSGDRVEDFMRYFAERFDMRSMGTADKIIAIALAHHRFNYVHPFFDGNGRVSRLMSHAMGLAAGIGARGLWSMSRGLARGLQDRGEYRRMMDHADMPRQGDLDGRGNLSQRATQEFVAWFLAVALDQLRYMSRLFQREGLADRYDRYVHAQGTLRIEAGALFRELLAKGTLARGEVGRVTGLGERTARTLIQDLVAAGLIGSSTPKGPLSLRFPREAIPVLFPNLYDAQALI